LPDLAHAHAHQFDDASQQREASSLGMWVFLVTEVMFFGGLFTGYAVYRILYPEGFKAASHHLEILLGAVNTTVLLGSSLTVALAVHAAELGRSRSVVGYLVATIVLGLAFLGVKAVEYTHEFQHGLFPGLGFAWEGPDARGARLFFGFYFAMTGMHALHMIIGLGMFGFLIAKTARGRFSPSYYTPIEMGGLYWHFVDIVWIFLFPLLYLIGHH
jgi:cytochrome c oxidase subunit III